MKGSHEAHANLQGRSRRTAFFSAPILMVIFCVETYFLFRNFDAQNKLLESSKATKLENNHLREKIRKITKSIKILDKEINQLGKTLGFDASVLKFESGYYQTETGQPLRLQRLSHRPEVLTQIQSQISNNSVAADAWKIRLLPAEHPDFWEQHRFQTHGAYGYIQYSGYRAGPRTFVSNGLHLIALAESRLLESCHWWGRDGSVVFGNLTLLRESQGGDAGKYEVAVLVCDLLNDTGTAGGHAVATVDHEQFIIVDEEPSEDPLPSLESDSEADFKHDLVFCSTCFHDSMVAQHVVDFLEFHRVIHGVSHFFFYDGGGIDAALRSKLGPYRTAGLATITDIREILLFNVFFWGKTLAVNDCLYRNRFSAKWMITMDMDEYIQLKPGVSLLAFLSQDAHKDAAFLTHGGYYWSSEYCVQGNESEKAGGPFVVERMLFRRKLPHCSKEGWRPELCWDVHGHRKLIVNPRRVNITKTHNVASQPGEQHLLVGEEVWHGHFPGLGSGYDLPRLCSRVVEVAGTGEVEDPKGFVVDDSLKKLVQVVKKCPLGSEKGCAAALLKME